ncbi:D-aminoacylase [Paenibacillus filicis]|uniref:D-aminoacylase n=1 Tax=Paenibacillus gyeongsangnamensis TaxID=3388067 RepID=A0ABT4QKE1_9BACL|nr:D-aminoacylase [Paenibacillus filicis]MCZ8517333.1 D-aminoacylase [Paenibacillus filicis]
MLDFVLKNGKIVDGTGNPWFIGDVGVKDGIIVKIGRIDQSSRSTIDVQKQVICPGFIDGHCHSDLMILDQPLSEIKLQQGVTTEVVGNCGIGPAPFFTKNGTLLQEYIEPILGKWNENWSWTTMNEYMNVLAAANASANVATYVPHGALRIAVMGFEKRTANKQELQHMKDLLEEGMRAGAIGLSIGLLYAPGSYTTKEELAELCGVLPKYNGILSTHIRGEGKNLLPSIKEVIWIAEKGGISLHISHLKAAGKGNWGKIDSALEIIEDARARGMDVTCDVYPYTAGSTSLTTLLPPWALEGGIRKTLERLKDSSVRVQIKEELKEEQEMWDNLVCSTGWENVLISSLTSEKNRHLEGKHIKEISAMQGKDPVDCAMDLLIEEEGKIAIVYFHMSDQEVNKVMRWEKSLIASDSLACQTGKPHPRLYGTFPRVFAKYVRQERLLSLEEAVRKVTSFPVQRFKLGKRGLLVPGYKADIVVFNPDNITDKATYQEPAQYPEGISYVYVNGVKTTEHKKHTHAREGNLIVSHTCCAH